MKAQTNPKYYETKWKQGDKKGTYRTKKLTAFHKEIHNNPKTDFAITLECDPSVPFPLGLYQEIIGRTDHKNPSKNKLWD